MTEMISAPGAAVHPGCPRAGSGTARSAPGGSVAARELREAGVLPERGEVLVLARRRPDVVAAELDRPRQRAQRVLRGAVQRVPAGEVVLRPRALRILLHGRLVEA